MWYEWDTKTKFNLWHNQICEQLGYPLTGFNQATGLPDENAQKTTDYTNVVKVENKWIAWVDEVYADGLTQTDLRIPVIDVRSEF